MNKDDSKAFYDHDYSKLDYFKSACKILNNLDKYCGTVQRGVAYIAEADLHSYPTKDTQIVNAMISKVPMGDFCLLYDVVIEIESPQRKSSRIAANLTIKNLENGHLDAYDVKTVKGLLQTIGILIPLVEEKIQMVNNAKDLVIRLSADLTLKKWRNFMEEIHGFFYELRVTLDQVVHSYDPNYRRPDKSDDPRNFSGCFDGSSRSVYERISLDVNSKITDIEPNSLGCHDSDSDSIDDSGKIYPIVPIESRRMINPRGPENFERMKAWDN